MKNLILIFAPLVAVTGCSRVTETPSSMSAPVGRATDVQNEAAFRQYWAGVEDSIHRTYRSDSPQQVK